MSPPLPHNEGLVLWIDLPSRQPKGHEQEGTRPCVVLADPATLQPLRFPVLVVAPLTSRGLPPAPLYPILSIGVGGLQSDSTVLLDQVLAVDMNRVKGYLGQLSPQELQPLKDGLKRLFKL